MAIRHERTVHDGRNFCGSDNCWEFGWYRITEMNRKKKLVQLREEMGKKQEKRTAREKKENWKRV